MAEDLNRVSSVALSELNNQWNSASGLGTYIAFSIDLLPSLTFVIGLPRVCVFMIPHLPYLWGG